MYCNKCGTQNPDDANFCIKCGNNFGSIKPEIERKGITGEWVTAESLKRIAAIEPEREGITGKLGKMGIPGFRSGKTWKMILATLVYFYVALAFFVFISGTPKDSDGDGWTDEQEKLMGTNPKNIDTDNDGIWDSEDDNPLDKNIPVKQAIQTPTPTPSPTPTATPEPPAEFGDRVIAGKFAYTFHEKYTTKEIGEYTFGKFYGRRASGIFLVLDVTVENLGKEPADLSSFFIRVIDVDSERIYERVYDAEFALAVYSNQETLQSSETLQPGLPKRGKIVFDIPTNLKNAKIRVRDDAWIFFTEKYVRLMGTQVKTAGATTEFIAESDKLIPVKLRPIDIDFKHKVEFVPANVKIKSGATIVWRNEDDYRAFTLISSESLFSDKIINSLQRYSYQFNTTGAYHFSIKEFPEVTATVEVI